MFKKSQIHKQLDMFSSQSNLMCGREKVLYEDPKAWHNKFFREVTSKVDEEIFKPLFTEGNEDNRNGRPNAPVRILVAMRILKEGCGCSDENLYEQCRFNLLFRAALGMFNLNDQCPSIDTYYGFYRSLARYNDENQEDLFEKCIKQITKEQAREYRISGKSIRMDSKLISSNIGWYSRYEIIHETFVKSVTHEELERIEDQMIRQQALEFFGEDAAKTVYRTDTETMGKRLLMLGIVIDHILCKCGEDKKSLLRRVFHEQYDKSDTGEVTVRDKRLISARSVQNPNDPEAHFRSKHGQKVKGYSVNITETTDEPDKPSLVTHVDVAPASTPDNTFVESGVNGSQEVTGNKVEVLHADGAYQSPENRKLAKDNTFDFVANGIQGKPGRFDLKQTGDDTLEVSDKRTGEVQTATLVKDGQWKIMVTNKDGRKSWRYFTIEQVEKSKVRRETESIPFEKRKKRNNVEATIFQYCFHMRNNKTRYRGRFKHMLQALARCAWINVRRLFLFDVRMSTQMA